MDNNTTPKAKKHHHKPKYKRLPAIYWEYFALLVATLLLFSAYALFCKDHTVSFELKKMSIERYADSLATADEIALPDSTQTDSVLSKTDNATTEATAHLKRYFYDYLNAPADTDSIGVRFLLIGDSMNEFLRLRLNDYCMANGHTMECVIWYGATTKQYGTCDTIAYFIRKFHPTYILLTIGSNELFVRDIIKNRTPYVQHIIEQLGNVPYVWVGPPNWKDDTGINELIISHVGPSRYFESKRLTFTRCKDGAHPVKSSALKWMDSIATYIATDASVPVAMNPPETYSNKTPHTTILQMVRE